MNFVPCAVWVKRGVAETNPLKVTVTKEELKRIIDENKEELKALGGDESTGVDDDPDEGNEDVDVNDDGTVSQREGQNGDDLDEYQLDKYDDEDASLHPLAGLAGLTLYASNDEDPYVTLKEEVDSDEDDEIIRPDDNLIVVGRVERDRSNLEVYVYNSEDHLYVHHDIMLPSPPLCVEWLDFDPDPEDDRPGNLVAVGTMSPVIEVWDVDLIDSLEPAFRLGRLRKESKKKKKSSQPDGELGHTDAVLDLSWNHNVRNVLASGSADHTVLLWDMATGAPVSSIAKHDDKVQTLEWHPFEAQTLLTGSYDNTVRVFDCRSADSANKAWIVEGEVERVIWNHFDPFCCLASTDRGFVYCLDPRVTTPVWTISAHSEACTGLSLSSQCPGCLVTVSTDRTMKVWDIQGGQPAFVAEKKLKLGLLYCLQGCPDDPFAFCSGGDYSSHNFDVENVMEMSDVCNRFGNRRLQTRPPGMEVAGNETTSNNAIAGADMDVEEGHAATSLEGSESLMGTSPSSSNSKRSKVKKTFAKKKGLKLFPEKKKPTK